MSQEDGLIEHDLKVWLEPDKNQLVVEDRITVLNSFSLNSFAKFFKFSVKLSFLKISLYASVSKYISFRGILLYVLIHLLSRI